MIGLRDLRSEDCERLFLWRRLPEIDRWMRGPALQTLEAHERWFDALRDDSDRRAWIIVEDSRAVGLLVIGGLYGGDRRGDWGWYIGEEAARGRGAGRAAQALGLDQAFGELGLHKVAAEVLADNEAALRAQAAAGFRREGYLRDHVLKDGTPRDVVLLGILAQEWARGRGRIMADLAASRLIAAPA
jgi:UDP-4-amino-4,6-dideoxy-N-acetyl-beta-L-altrosamine N-acetyltransferase